MTQAAVAEKSDPKQQLIPQMVDTSYFIIQEDEYEKKAAREYIRSKYPNTQARIVTELRLDRLTDKHTVYALFRDNERSPAVHLVANANGIRELRPAPVAELAAEVKESKAIRCADFWMPAREGNEGELDLSTFLSELGKRCAPAAIKYYPAQGILKLGFG